MIQPAVTATQPRPLTPLRQFAARHWSRKRTFIVVLAVFFTLLGGVALEAGLRIFYPYLMPQKGVFNKDTGLPRDQLEAKWGYLKDGPYDLIAIGDSFVATGNIPTGWIVQLGKTTGRRILELGFQGACPSQYFALLDRLRATGNTTPVLVVIYLGNDCFDEAVYARQGEDKSPYFNARYAFLSDPKQPTFWPGCERPPWSWLSNHSAIYRAAVLSRVTLSSLLHGPAKDPADPNHWDEAAVRKLMTERCDKQPWAQWVGGRLYLFQSHQAMVDPNSERIQQGQARILDLLRRHQKDAGLTVAVALDQEEVSEAAHGRKIHHAAPFIEKMKMTGVKILDLNPDFFKASKDKCLFYSDGHWNSDGHALVAAEVRKYFGF